MATPYMAKSLPHNYIRGEACACPGREKERCIWIISPSGYILATVSSFPSCETPVEMNLAAESERVVQRAVQPSTKSKSRGDSGAQINDKEMSLTISCLRKISKVQILSQISYDVGSERRKVCCQNHWHAHKCEQRRPLQDESS